MYSQIFKYCHIICYYKVISIIGYVIHAPREFCDGSSSSLPVHRADCGKRPCLSCLSTGISWKFDFKLQKCVVKQKLVCESHSAFSPNRKKNEFGSLLQRLLSFPRSSTVSLIPSTEKDIITGIFQNKKALNQRIFFLPCCSRQYIKMHKIN